MLLDPLHVTEVSPVDAGHARQFIEFTDLSNAVAQMQKDISIASQKWRAQAIDRHNAKTNVSPPKFTLVDFVLLGTVQRSKLSKISVIWQGPYRVIRSLNLPVVEVENLLSNRKTEAHITSVKLYSHTALHAEEELKEMLEYQQSLVYRVDTIEGLVRNRRNFQVRVSWLGIPGEDTWHNLSDIYQYIPDTAV